MTWKIFALKNPLRLNVILEGGQAFTWRRTGTFQWSNYLNNKYLISLRQEPQTLDRFEYHVHNSVDDEEITELLNNYFQTDVDINALYKEWCKRDSSLKLLEDFQAISMLDQDPIENLFSFICSSNNNIIRITSMVLNLCNHFGTFVGSVTTNFEDEEPRKVHVYSFPKVEALAADGAEQKMRDLGFGYRAKYIYKTAKMLLEKNDDAFLYKLRYKDYNEVVDTLLEFHGVGRKVADCVCLMSLKKTDAVPIDTHIWNVAMTKYKIKGLKGKTLNETNYKAIGNFFRDLHGPFAGWAQTIIFTADLRYFK
jgi:N-glycosylase/DNA lyase